MYIAPRAKCFSVSHLHKIAMLITIKNWTIYIMRTFQFIPLVKVVPVVLCHATRIRIKLKAILLKFFATNAKSIYALTTTEIVFFKTPY